MPRQPIQRWLEQTLEAAGAIAGTVHLYDPASGSLRLTAWVNIPPPVQAATQWIPKGKGMAGLAWARREPVQTCNLPSDPSKDIKPGARAVLAQGAAALPVFADDGQILGVVGFAFEGPDADPLQLTPLAARLPTVPN